MDEIPLELDLDGILAKLHAAESEGHISALLEEMGNISTDEDGYQLCPWCTGRLNQKRTHQKNCPHQAAGGWLETHDSPK